MPTAPSPGYVCLDTETTGLTERDQIWRIAWILLDANGETLYTREATCAHVVAPSPWVLQKTRYVATMSDEKAIVSNVSAETQFLRKIIIGTGLDPSLTHLVGANPSFDDRFVRRSVGTVPWSYHLIDIETLIMGAFGLAAPPSLRELADLTGIQNLAPHDAMGDAIHVCHLFRWWKQKMASQLAQTLPQNTGLEAYLRSFTLVGEGA